jgi:hypothetical protein
MANHQNPEIRERRLSDEDLQELAAGGHLYAVIDSCNVPMAPKKSLELGNDRAISLYRGSPEQDFWDVAPYLLKVDTGVLEWLRTNASKEGWGIFIASKADLGALRHHLRHFLKVQPPEGNVWFFRFYDPRVLRPFLPACSANELRMFFGPVLAYGIAEPDVKNATFFQPVQPRFGSEDPALLVKYSIIFSLRPQHVEALRAQAEASFRQRLIRHLRNERVPGVDELDDIRLEAKVCFGIDRARKYGFKWPVNFATFVAFMFRFAPNFDQHPHVRAVLTDSSVDCEYRFNTLVQQITDSEWRQIVRDADQALWPHVGTGVNRG